MADCPEVILGSVSIPTEDYGKIQSAADQGRNLWRLSPIRTAQIVGSEHLGLSPTDVYTMVEQFIEPGSGLPHAVVRVKHGPCTFLVELYQPEKRGPKGIWIVDSVLTVER
ncbi:hypothetical protein ACOALA_10285 [Alicyclobacillus acidoterrestris]|uniref:hypothetical protein n=1 Tax=Alicyclobacillus acidoterrestris TaxID=1450 RepID=UPI003F53DFB4